MTIIIQGNLQVTTFNGVPLVLANTTQTLTNKIITDSTNTIAAHQLSSLTTHVVIGNMAAPTAGQVLTAYDENLAGWQTPSSGGGIFGSEYEYSSADTISTTTSTSFQTKLNFTTASKPAGTYRIGWYYEYNESNTTVDFFGRVLLDDVTTLNTVRQEPSEAAGVSFGNSDQSFTCSGFYVVTFDTDGTHNIKIQYNSESTSFVASIRRARVEIYRVA